MYFRRRYLYIPPTFRTMSGPIHSTIDVSLTSHGRSVLFLTSTRAQARCTACAVLHIFPFSSGRASSACFRRFAAEQKVGRMAPLPVLPLLAISMSLLSQIFVQVSLFAYVGYMVQHLDVVDSKDEAGETCLIAFFLFFFLFCQRPRCRRCIPCFATLGRVRFAAIWLSV